MATELGSNAHEYGHNPDLVTFALTFLAFALIGNNVTTLGLLLLLLTAGQYAFRLTPIWSDVVKPMVVTRYLWEDIEPIALTAPPPEMLEIAEARAQLKNDIFFRVEPVPDKETDQWLTDILAEKE